MQYNNISYDNIKSIYISNNNNNSNISNQNNNYNKKIIK